MSDEFVAAKNAGPLALISTFVTSCSCTLYSRRPTAMHRMNQTRKSRCFKNVGDIRGEGVHMHDRLQAFGRQIYAYPVSHSSVVVQITPAVQIIPVVDLERKIVTKECKKLS